MTLATIADYEVFVYSLRDSFSSVLSSTLRVVRTGPATGRVIGTLSPRLNSRSLSPTCHS